MYNLIKRILNYLIKNIIFLIKAIFNKLKTEFINKIKGFIAIFTGLYDLIVTIIKIVDFQIRETSEKWRYFWRIKNKREKLISLIKEIFKLLTKQNGYQTTSGNILKEDEDREFIKEDQLEWWLLEELLFNRKYYTELDEVLFNIEESIEHFNAFKHIKLILDIRKFTKKHLKKMKYYMNNYYSAFLMAKDNFFIFYIYLWLGILNNNFYRKRQYVNPGPTRLVKIYVNLKKYFFEKRQQITNLFRHVYHYEFFLGDSVYWLLLWFYRWLFFMICTTLIFKNPDLVYFWVSEQTRISLKPGSNLCHWVLLLVLRQFFVVSMMFDVLRSDKVHESDFYDYMIGIIFCVYFICLWRTPYSWPYYEIWVLGLEIW